jgi:FtsP/CotA-like multicopper oxidase with cupredoxin domain
VRHRFAVIALDGNPVPTPVAAEAAKRDVAERGDVMVEMDNPGVWVFGSTDDADRNMGMGVIVEYADRRGEPQWIAWRSGNGTTRPSVGPTLARRRMRPSI